MKTIRIDLKSPPDFGDEDVLEGIRDAVSSAGLSLASVACDAEGAVVVEFDVEGEYLGDALTRGERELARVLSVAGIAMRFHQGGATGWLS